MMANVDNIKLNRDCCKSKCLDKVNRLADIGTKEKELERGLMDMMELVIMHLIIQVLVLLI